MWDGDGDLSVGMETWRSPCGDGEIPMCGCGHSHACVGMGIWLRRGWGDPHVGMGIWLWGWDGEIRTWGWGDSHVGIGNYLWGWGYPHVGIGTYLGMGWGDPHVGMGWVSDCEDGDRSVRMGMGRSPCADGDLSVGMGIYIWYFYAQKYWIYMGWVSIVIWCKFFKGNLMQKQKNTAILHSKQSSKWLNQLKLFCHSLCSIRLHKTRLFSKQRQKFITAYFLMFMMPTECLWDATSRRIRLNCVTSRCFLLFSEKQTVFELSWLSTNSLQFLIG